MQDALSWWSKNNNTVTANVQEVKFDDGAQDFQEVMQWWAANGKLYKSSIKARRAGYIRKYLAHRHRQKYGTSDKAAAKLAQEMAQSLEWWRQHQHTWNGSNSFEQAYYDDLSKMQKVNDLFDWWEYKELPSEARLDLTMDPVKGVKIGKKFAKALEGYLQYDADDLNFCVDDFNFVMVEDGDSSKIDPNRRKVQHAIVQYLQHQAGDATRSSQNMDEILAWWDANGLQFDPDTASADDLLMFQKVKSLAGNWHLKDLPSPDSEEWKKLKKEIKSALHFWRRNAGNTDLEDYEVEKLRQIKHACLDVNRYVTSQEAKNALADIQNHIQWFKSNGESFDKSTASDFDVARFELIQDLYGNWNWDPKQAAEWKTKEMGEALSWWVRHGHGLDVNQYDGEDVEKMKLVADVLQQWQARGATQASDTFLSDLVICDGKQLADALARWETIKDWDESQWTPEDQFMVMRLKDMFLSFVPDKNKIKNRMISCSSCAIPNRSK
jgi:hypothetical protein